MMKRRRRKLEIHTPEKIWCKVCSTNWILSNSNVTELICGDCYARIIYRLEIAETKDTIQHPKGWNLKKKYVAPDGKVYKYGKEIVEKPNATNTKKTNTKTRKVLK